MEEVAAWVMIRSCTKQKRYHRPRRPLGTLLSLVPLLLDELSENFPSTQTSAPRTGKLSFQFQALDEGLTPHQNMEFKCWRRQG